MVAGAAIVLGLTPLGLQRAGAFSDPAGEGEHVQLAFDACRLTAGSTLPIAGAFICPDAMYTSGNLGKSWNELDLVPHRLTTTIGTQSAATTDYTVTAAADGVTNAKVGYDVISPPVVNAAKSHASCAVSSTATATRGTAVDPFGGGTDTVIYKDLTIHQDVGTVCVLDWYQRLALGAHLYAGASLQSYIYPGADLGGSKKTISIPVNQIAPQELSKDMAASQGTDHVWNVTKSPTPANVGFIDTCATGAPRTAPVQIQVSWTKQPATATGPITVITHVYATNPAARMITVGVTDIIYSGTTAIHTSPTATYDVPANTANQLVLTHTTTVPNGTTNLNDIATATYTDKVTGVAVPGTTTATASAAVQANDTVTNRTATITDVESITGAGLEFSTDSVTGSGGSFGGGYVLGTRTTGPVSWTSSPQSGSGSVTFNKTVYVDQGVAVTGALTDTATVNGSSGFTASADGNVDITAGATVSLTIDKTISTGLGSGDSDQTFTFVVTGPGGYSSSPTITFGQGDGGTVNPKATTLTGLAPGTYTVAEQDQAPWKHQDPVQRDISLPRCSYTVAINNAFGPASAQVQKVTVPAGTESGWRFDLLKESVVIASATTTGSGHIDFGVALTPGSYTVVEQTEAGYDQTGASTACTFSVNYPADADRTYSCSYTNTRRGSITIKKLTNPASSTQSFTFTGDVSGSLGNNDTATAGVAPGTYHSTEATLPGWDLTDISCTDDDSEGDAAAGIVTFKVAAGENVTCTFTNRLRGATTTTTSGVGATTITTAKAAPTTIGAQVLGVVFEAPAAEPAAVTLPRTGGSVRTLLIWAATVLSTGVWLMLLSLRRRPRGAHR